jgi:spore coat protein U-like protein
MYSKMTKYISRAALAATALALGVSGANAYNNVVNQNLIVSATVITACSVTGGTLSFGRVAPGNGATAPSTGVSVNCGNGVPYTVNLSQGANWDSGNGKWQVADSGGTNFIHYILQNSANTGANWTPASLTGTGSAQPLTIYGALEVVGTQPAGDYTDTVQIQVNY